MQTLSSKDAEYSFGRLIDLARAAPGADAKYERLKALDTPRKGGTGGR